MAATSNKKLTREEILEERRKQRTDLGSMRTVMPYPSFEGSEKFMWRWVNNDLRAGVNRVKKLESLGWAVFNEREKFDVTQGTNVTESNIDLGSGVTLAVGTNARGEPLTAVLMYIRKDLYDLDQDLKEEAIRETEKDLLNQGQKEGMYGGVNIGRV